MRFTIAALAAFVAGASAFVAQQHPLEENVLASLILNEGAEIVPGEFIVMYKPTVNDPAALTASLFAAALEKSPESELIHEYDNGFAAKLNDDALLAVRQNADVDFVEPNQMVHADDTQDNVPSWGLARISTRKNTRTSIYTYPSSAGEGVDVYVIDTGININHVEFEGRAKWGFTAPRGDSDTDGNGHGTHVSGTVAGKTVGVAKKAQVIAVKVLRANGSGTTADVVKGIEWAANAAAASRGTRRSTANMSLGGGRSAALDNVVAKAIESGLQFAVAAGNSGANACNYSPAGVEAAVTVGATAKNDARAYFSNTGTCVDIFAPGLDITSAWKGSNTARTTISGTSMASPHVAGVMALLLGDADLSAADLKAKVLEIATPDILTSIGYGSPNLNLYSLAEPVSVW